MLTIPPIDLLLSNNIKNIKILTYQVNGYEKKKIKQPIKISIWHLICSDSSTRLILTQANLYTRSR